jgi:hypothetical protein
MEYRVAMVLLIFGAVGHAQNRGSYPAHWWTPIPEDQKAWWEILPQAANSPCLKTLPDKIVWA